MATFVRTASIYIDDVETPGEATVEVNTLNSIIEHGEVVDAPSGTIVLAEDSEWEKVKD